MLSSRVVVEVLAWCPLSSSILIYEFGRWYGCLGLVGLVGQDFEGADMWLGLIRNLYVVLRWRIRWLRSLWFRPCTAEVRYGYNNCFLCGLGNWWQGITAKWVGSNILRFGYCWTSQLGDGRFDKAKHGGLIWWISSWLTHLGLLDFNLFRAKHRILIHAW